MVKSRPLYSPAGSESASAMEIPPRREPQVSTAIAPRGCGHSRCTGPTTASTLNQRAASTTGTTRVPANQPLPFARQDQQFQTDEEEQHGVEDFVDQFPKRVHVLPRLGGHCKRPALVPDEQPRDHGR